MALTSLQFNKNARNQVNEIEMFLRKRFFNDMKYRLEMEINEEIDYIKKKTEELDNCEKIMSVCPRCGKRLVYEKNNIGYYVKCEREKCVNIKYRQM